MKNSYPLNIVLTLRDRGRMVSQFKKVGKIKFFIDREAKKWLFGDRSCRIEVNYGKVRTPSGEVVLSKNNGEYKTVEDLKWAYQAFYKDYLTSW